MSLTTASPPGLPAAPLPRAGRAAVRPRRRRRDWTGLLYVAPAVALVLAFFVVPLVLAAWMSLHNWPLLGRSRWIGLGNYKALWNDRGFWNALLFTAKYTLAATVGLIGVALPLALFVERPRRFVGFYRTAYFLPVVIGFASASLVWAWLANVDSGLFSPLAAALGLTDGRVNLLAGFGTAFWAVIAMVVWKYAGFYMIIFMGALQSVPADYHEAARIDGATWWQRLRFITLPLIRRPIALALILAVTGSMLAFDQFYIILAGGPNNSTVTAVYWIFNQSFVSFRLGYGAALSMVLLAILMLVSLVQLRLLRSPEDAA